jgi:hypothetical protein
MQVLVEGLFLAAEPWEFEGRSGFTVSILQDIASAKVTVRTDVAPAKWPERMTPVRIEGSVRPGWEGRGFKVEVSRFEMVGAKT